MAPSHTEMHSHSENRASANREIPGSLPLSPYPGDPFTPSHATLEAF